MYRTKLLKEERPQNNMKDGSRNGHAELIIMFLLFTFLGACTDSKAKQSTQRVVPVKIGVVIQQNVPVQINAIGNVESYNTVSIKALVGGEVTDVHFKEGQEVKK